MSIETPPRPRFVTDPVEPTMQTNERHLHAAGVRLAHLRRMLEASPNTNLQTSLETLEEMLQRLRQLNLTNPAADVAEELATFSDAIKVTEGQIGMNE